MKDPGDGQIFIELLGKYFVIFFLITTQDLEKRLYYLEGSRYFEMKFFRSQKQSHLILLLILAWIIRIMHWLHKVSHCIYSIVKVGDLGVL